MERASQRTMPACRVANVEFRRESSTWTACGKRCYSKTQKCCLQFGPGMIAVPGARRLLMSLRAFLGERGQQPPVQAKNRAPSYRTGESIAQVKVTKSFPVTLCGRCSRRWSNATSLAKLGWGLAGFMFIAAVILGVLWNLQVNGVAAAFCLGSLLGWLGERWQKRSTGTKVVALPGNSLAFGFRNKEFTVEFCQHNSCVQSVAVTRGHRD